MIFLHLGITTFTTKFTDSLLDNLSSLFPAENSLRFQEIVSKTVEGALHSTYNVLLGVRGGAGQLALIPHFKSLFFYFIFFIAECKC